MFPFFCPRNRFAKDSVSYIRITPECLAGPWTGSTIPVNPFAWMTGCAGAGHCGGYFGEIDGGRSAHPIARLPRLGPGAELKIAHNIDQFASVG